MKILCTQWLLPTPSFQFLWYLAESKRELLHLRIHPSSSICSHIINKLQWSSSTGSHVNVIMLPTPCLTNNVIYFGSWAVSLPLHILQVQVNLCLICPKNLNPELDTLFQMHFIKFYFDLPVFECYQWFAPCTPLYLHSWRLVVDFDNMSAPSRVFLTWQLVRGFTPPQKEF